MIYGVVFQDPKIRNPGVLESKRSANAEGGTPPFSKAKNTDMANRSAWNREPIFWKTDSLINYRVGDKMKIELELDAEKLEDLMEKIWSTWENERG